MKKGINEKIDEKIHETKLKTILHPNLRIVWKHRLYYIVRENDIVLFCEDEDGNTLGISRADANKLYVKSKSFLTNR